MTGEESTIDVEITQWKLPAEEEQDEQGISMIKKPYNKKHSSILYKTTLMLPLSGRRPFVY